MWISERSRGEPREEQAGLGVVTLDGMPAGVYLDGERRAVAVYAPGGYRWRPTAGQAVLVLKTGEEGETPCLVGAQCDGEGLQPGEVELSCEGRSAGLRLKQDGKLVLTGEVFLNGVSLKALCKQWANEPSDGTGGGTGGTTP